MGRRHTFGTSPGAGAPVNFPLRPLRRGFSRINMRKNLLKLTLKTGLFPRIFPLQQGKLKASQIALNSPKFKVPSSLESPTENFQRFFQGPPFSYSADRPLFRPPIPRVIPFPLADPSGALPWLKLPDPRAFLLFRLAPVVPLLRFRASPPERHLQDLPILFS